MSVVFELKISELLIAEFEKRVAEDSKYSRRRFARFLGLPISTLLLLLSGKSDPTLTTIRAIGKKLEWDQGLINNALESCKRRKRKKRLKKVQKSDAEANSELLGSRAPLAIFALAKTHLIPASVQKISDLLGIDEIEIQRALDYLISVRLVTVENGVMKSDAFRIAEDPGSELMKSYSSDWLSNASQQFLDCDHGKTNAMLFNVFLPETQLHIFRNKFSTFMRSIKFSVPEIVAEGELYCVGAVVFPFKKAKTNSRIV